MKFNKISKKRSKGMKKFLMIVLAVLMGISLVTTVFAQTTTEKATKAATTDTAKEKGKALGDKATQAATDKTAPAPAKVKVQKYAGKVTAIDMAAKTLTVKGKKGEMTFDVTDAKMKTEPKAGDKVMVKYTEKDGKMVAKCVTGKAHKKAAKKGTKKGTKKGAKPAETPVVPAPTN
jgi:microtubule-associated protein 1